MKMNGYDEFDYDNNPYYGSDYGWDSDTSSERTSYASGYQAVAKDHYGTARTTYQDGHLPKLTLKEEWCESTKFEKTLIVIYFIVRYFIFIPLVVATGLFLWFIGVLLMMLIITFPHGYWISQFAVDKVFGLLKS